MSEQYTPQPREVIEGLHPYQPGMSIEALQRKYGLDDDILKLASNENPYGASPKAMESIRSATATDVSLYPDNFDFTSAVAQKFDVDSSMVLVGNGSNDVLDIIARTYLNEGDEAISSEYGFVVYGISTKLCGANNVVVPAVDYGHDLQGMLKAITPKTKIIFIANPNNPTGTFVPGDEVKQFLGDVPSEVVVVLDEAYSEYLAAEDAIDSTSWLSEHPNLIVVKTLSKIYGLAGLRIGFSLASPEITQYMNRARQPFNASVIALKAGAAALQDTEHVMKSAEQNRLGLSQLQAGLDELGVSSLPSRANFLTAEFTDAAKVHEALLKKGIIVRGLAPYNMPNHLRITIGRPEDNQAVLQALRDILATT